MPSGIAARGLFSHQISGGIAMSIRNFAGLALLSGLFIAGGFLLAADDEKKSEPKAAEKTPETLFRELDKNGDGVLTSDEAGEDRRRFFERIVRVADKDKNGELTQAEFLEGVKPDDLKASVPPGGAGQFPRPDPRQLFDQFDRNKDGKLSLEELPERMAERLKPAFERSGKKELSPEEFARVMAERMRGDGAGPGFGDPQAAFRRVDRNGDGKVTADEAPEFLRPRIAEAIKNAGKKEDEGLSIEEFTKVYADFRPRGAGPGGAFNAEAMFRRLDRDGDGKIKLDEVPEQLRPLAERAFEQAGKGKDAALTAEEFAKALPALGQPGGGGFPGGQPGQPGFGPPRGGFQPMLFRRLDANGDGKVTKEELQKVGELFDELDANKDGTLDAAELIGFGGRPGGGGVGGFPPGGGPGGQPRPEGRPQRRAEQPPDRSEDRPAEKKDESAQAGATAADGALANRRDAARARGRPAARRARRFDTDGDGRISLEESQGRLKERFKEFDRNSNGFLEADEIRQALRDLGEARTRRRAPEA
jgi:Ca2+-binding EF-hand superfamily protein